jgi:hypothetical protein
MTFHARLQLAKVITLNGGPQGLAATNFRTVESLQHGEIETLWMFLMSKLCLGYQLLQVRQCMLCGY